MIEHPKPGEQYLGKVVVDATLSGKVISSTVHDVFASNKEEAAAKIAALPDQVRNEYEDPGVSTSIRSSITFEPRTPEELQDSFRRDEADVERQISAWMS